MTDTAYTAIADEEAEEYVLGAMMLASSAIERVTATGLEAPDFYRESHQKIYRAALSLHQLGRPVDAITISDRLEELGSLEQVGGKDRIRDIATVVPATTNVAHHAEIVLREARRRRLANLGELLQRRALESVDPDEIHAEAEKLLLLETVRGSGSQPIEGLTHAQVLALELPAQRYLVDDLIPIGSAGTIAAVPESHKSWLAQAIAVRVAAGQGWILNHKVTTKSNVGYFWQDDSMREEAERVQAFEEAHAQPADLPVTWFLNPGLELPRDLNRIRSTIEHHQLGLIVLDSLYNFLPGVDLKDDAPEKIIAQLKVAICDPTDCTVLVVDHMGWANEARTRNRSYGGVFKNAATRFGIYIDIINEKIHIEARGNNITGFKGLAYWDKTSLELKIVAGSETAEEDLKAPPLEIAQYVDQEGGDVLAKYVRAHFEISDRTLTARLQRLTEIGIDYFSGRGRPARLIRRAETTEPDVQMDISDNTEVEPASEHFGGQSVVAHGDTSSDVRSSELTSELGTSELKPSDRAKKFRVPNTPETSALRNSESGDMQGKQPPPTSDSPTEREPTMSELSENGNHRTEPEDAGPPDHDHPNGNGDHPIASAELELGEDEAERLLHLAAIERGPDDIDFT